MNSAQRSACSSTFSLALLLCAACGGGGGGGGGGGVVPPPADTSALPPTTGLVSACAGDASIRVTWRAVDADGQPVAVALFAGSDRSNVYAGVPLVTATGNGSLQLAGQVNGVERFFGLAFDDGAGGFAPSGTVLVARPAAPIFVDAASLAPTPDGSTPALAFRAPIDAVLQAFAQGGGNVWLAAGSYADVALPLWPGVHVYGGFDASFALAARDPQAHPTRLNGRAGAALAEILGGDPGAVLDGCTLDGAGVAPFGVDIDQASAELRSLVIENCLGRGVRVRSAALDRAFDVRIAASRVASNGAEGVSVDGAFDLWVEGSRFANNGFEGFDCSALVAPDGVPVRLRVHDSAFAGNGQEGLDCDMVPPLQLGAAGGRYAIEIANSRFEDNGSALVPNSMSGLNLDIDFELVTGWSADIVVRGCTARSNKGDGIKLDLDSTCTAFVHRVSCSSNGANGLSVSSESTPAWMTISASAFVGNVGAGMRAGGGQVPYVASHCVVAGNGAGGATSEALASSVSSSVAWLQPTPWSNVRQHFDVTASDVLAPPFERAPIDYGRATGFDGTFVTLAAGMQIVPGDLLELADDGQLRSVLALGAGGRVSVEPLPTVLLLPALVARYDSAGSATEDYHLSPTSSASAAGMPTTGGPADAGPFGAPLGGEPGRESAPRAPLFFAARSTPSVGSNVGALQTLRFTFFGGTLDAISVSPQSVRARDALGAALQVAAFVQGGELVVQPPAGGWPAGTLLVELHPALRSTAGVDLAAPVALPFTRP